MLTSILYKNSCLGVESLILLCYEKNAANFNAGNYKQKNQEIIVNKNRILSIFEFLGVFFLRGKKALARLFLKISEVGSLMKQSFSMGYWQAVYE